MSDSKRAVDTVAVLERRVPATIVAVVVVAWLAEVMGAKAAEECRGATVHALPINLSSTMLFTVGLSCAKLLQEALLADQVLRLAVISSLGILNLTVNETTEIWLLAAVALEERAAMVRKLLWLVVVDVSWSRESLIVEDALLLCSLHGKFVDLHLQGHQRAQLGSDRL